MSAIQPTKARGCCYFDLHSQIQSYFVCRGTKIFTRQGGFDENAIIMTVRFPAGELNGQICKVTTLQQLFFFGGFQMRKFSMMTSKPARLAAGAVLVAVLAACGGGDANPPVSVQVAATNTTVAINPSTGAAAVGAVLDKTFAFTAVPVFGTTTATSVKLSGTGAAPTFAIESGGRTATGNLTFGSCIFTITTSAFVAPSPLAVGQRLTVNPCALTAATSGVVANGSPTERAVTLDLSGTSSAGVSLQVSIAPNGNVTVGNAVLGSVPIVNTTGTGSGG